MTMHSVKNYRFALVQRNRGRPPTTTDADRARGYQDAEGNYALGEMKPWHIRVVDYMLANPSAKIVDIAKEFSVTPQWMGRLMKADSFKEYYEQRLTAHQDTVSVELVSKMQNVATKALEGVVEKLENKEVKFDEMLDAADLALKGLGYTAKSGMNVNVKSNSTTTNVTLVDASVVERARAKMLQKMRENSNGLTHDEDAYTSVTASLEVSDGLVEDAEVVDDDDSV